ncbi:MAG: polyribonucleotide nucleotidyltransferase, partial [Parcubacteria group bacterium]|nr:polyribonucleotide nucleotidyltransferase [Parcubacteria group bacterium]
MIKPKHLRTTLGGRELIVEAGRLAPQANGSVVVTYGETVVLATVVMGNSPREGIDYFPLTVDYEEKFYAAGRIKGSRWIKREGRPTDEAILTDRLIDRSLRPLFDQRLRNDVQIVVTVLSFDEENDPDVIALLAASTALHISDIPWGGPVASIRLGLRGASEHIVNPTYAERDASDIDIVISGTRDRINMIETKAKEVSEDTIVHLTEQAQEEIQRLIDFQKDIANEVGKPSYAPSREEEDGALKNDVRTFLGNRLKQAIFDLPAYDHMVQANALKSELGEYVLRTYDPQRIRAAHRIFEDEVDRLVHDSIIEHEQRPDHRSCAELREISCAVGLLPRTHGSGLFQRGQTQALSVLTLGAPGAEQMLESMEIVGKKRFMHHYNFPPFSTGEVGRLSGPGRREIGHGALAEKALEPVIPPHDIFPYTIRIVSEILSSNGSSSMASVCGATLALMDAGVPITR